MTIEKINEIIENYDKLIGLATKKAKFISSLDNEFYQISKEISEISFEDTFHNVFVSCEGDYKNDYSAFTFPMKWLVTDDSELESIVLSAKKFREDEKIRLEEEKKNKRLKEIEQWEFENYKKLKEKFG